MMLDEIAAFLEAQGVGHEAETGTGPRLMKGSLPNEPDDVICIYTYPGGPPEYVQNSFSPIAERPQIQVVARSIRSEDAEAYAWNAWLALAPVTNTRLGSTYYRSIRPNGSPALLKRDSNDRTLIFFNASVDKEVSVVAGS